MGMRYPQRLPRQPRNNGQVERLLRRIFTIEPNNDTVDGRQGYTLLAGQHTQFMDYGSQLLDHGVHAVALVTVGVYDVNNIGAEFQITQVLYRQITRGF